MFSMMQNENSQFTFPSKMGDADYWQAYLFYLQTLIMKSTQIIYQNQQRHLPYQSIVPIPKEKKLLMNNSLSSSHYSGTNSNNEAANDLNHLNKIFGLFELNYTQDHKNQDQENNMKSKSSLFKINLEQVDEEREEDKSLIEDLFLQKKKKRNAKICTDCPHHFAKHYAKNMCSNCYHSRGRNKKPWNCNHGLKPHYALGLCQNCYQMHYTKNRKENSLSNSQDS